MYVYLCCLVCLPAIFAAQKSYEGYKLYQILPRTQEDVHFLRNITKHPDHYDYWTSLRQNHLVDLMVAPEAHPKFSELIGDLHHTVKLENVETYMKKGRLNQRRAPNPLKGHISFRKFHRFETIQDYLDRISWEHSDIVQKSIIGKSYEGRDITVIKISTGGHDKPAILIDAGIHAREWISPAVALFVIHQLVENRTNEHLIQNVDWYIIPTLNPDGYEYTHTEERLWRKTRSRGGDCFGVDANRNFDIQFGQQGTSNDECDDIYPGSHPFSEPETIALKDFILKNKSNIKLYLNLHSYGPYILYSWGFTRDLPPDVEELHSLGNKVNAAIRAYRGTNYIIGSPPYVLYEASGISYDWAKAVAGIELSYTIELAGSSFDPDSREIRDIVQETWLGFVAYHEHISQKFT